MQNNKNSSNHYRWWLATRADEPARILSYGEAILATIKDKELRIISCDYKGKIVNRTYKVTMESNTNSILIIHEPSFIRLIPENQVTPGTEVITKYWFSSDDSKDIVTFDDIVFDPESSLGKTEIPLELHGMLASHRALRSDHGNRVNTIVRLSDDGTCLVICLLDNTTRRYYLLEQPATKPNPIAVTPHPASHVAHQPQRIAYA